MSALGELQEGSVFAGEFRIVRRLGEGGMGALYVAEQLATGRERALKLMHPTLVGSPSLRDKFTLEARVGGRIASEHVVEVVAAGVDAATGAPWLAMELLAGEDLGRRIARLGPLPLGDAAVVLEQVAHALGAAHRANIVHRDLKPENVFLAEARRAAESFTVKLLDFGIAKVIEEAQSGNTGAIGSPFWMAPEQTERDATIGPPTDVWAMGLVVYAMLAGRPFWHAASPETGSVAAFMRELVVEPIPPASARAGEQGAHELVPPWLDPWFARCLARDPGRRFADAAQAWDAFRASLPAGSAPRATLTSALPSSGGRGSGPAISGPAGSGPAGSGPAGSGPAISAPAGSGPALSAGRTTPLSPGVDPALGTARTVHDAPEVEEHAPLPTEGSSMRMLAIAGALVAVAAVGIGAIGLRGRSGATADVDAGAAAPLPPCPRGMVRVPGAELAMGRDDGPSEEAPTHKVVVQPFCLDDGEVTAAEYKECVDRKGCGAPSPRADWPGIGKDEAKAWSGLCTFGRDGLATHPMNCVTYDEAQAYCAWQGRRLPTEPEWELAARGTDGRTYPWGNTPPGPRRVNACDKGCTKVGRGAAPPPIMLEDDGWEATSPAGQLTEGAGPFGVFDLAGNVAEWTDSSFCLYSQPSCGNVARAIRGGSFLSDEPAELRTTARSKAAPQTRAAHIGFRCAR